MIVSRFRKRWKKTQAWLQGLWAVRALLPWHRWRQRPIGDITAFQRFVPLIERREFSQNGEDGIIAAIFGIIGVTNKYCVEFGVEDGMQSNTRYLVRKKNWKGLWMDGGDYPADTRAKASCDGRVTFAREFVTAENIEELFGRYGVPETFDLLSIDIDGNDYWVWKSIVHYRPRVVIIEYNAHIPPSQAKTIPYDPAFAWDKTDYYGASLLALKTLGEEKGYTLLGTDKHGVNAFFVESSLVPGHFAPPPWPHTYHPPAFKGQRGRGHPSDPKHRSWMNV